MLRQYGKRSSINFGAENRWYRAGICALGAASFAHELRLPDDGSCSSEIGHTQSMLLDGKLQFMNRGHPLGSLLIEGSGTQFADAIFETARGHNGRHTTSRPT